MPDKQNVTLNIRPGRYQPLRNSIVKPSDFKRWRKSLGLSQKEAAQALGLKRRVVQYYEKGERDGEKVSVPKTVRLACYALMAGVFEYEGPAAAEGSDSAPKPLTDGVPAKPVAVEPAE